MKRLRFYTMITALLFIISTLMSCKPTIVDSTPQNETTTSSSTTIVDKDPIVSSWYGKNICLHKYKSNPSPYDVSLFDNEYYIGPYEKLEAIEPGKYFIQSMSCRDRRFGWYTANGDFYFDNVVLKVNKRYSIDRDHIEEKNQ